MIRKIKVQNFKSLHGEGDDFFELSLGQFTCLIGLNGSGKSTILQFFDFLTHLMRDEVSLWLVERGWEAKELKYRSLSLDRSKRRVNINFEVVLDSSRANDGIVWKASFNPTKRYCVREEIVSDGNTIFQVKQGRYSFGNGWEDVAFQYEGSILSSIKDKLLPVDVLHLKNHILDVKSLDLLSPHLLRTRSRGYHSDIGRGGEYITSFLHSIDDASKGRIVSRLKNMYPNFGSFSTTSMEEGWKELIVLEAYKDSIVPFNSRHASDGLLRLLAIVAEIESEHSFLLLDEIENGINPEVIERLVHLLVSAPSQVLVTTHNPLILNYLEDKTAAEAVQLVYKTKNGVTRAVPFFSLPGPRERLESMGPGEVFVDTYLEDVVRKIRPRAR